MQAGIVTISTWGIVIAKPLALDMETNATTAAAIGEQVMPTWDAMEATPQGLSGRIPFLRAMSQMMGIRV